MSYLSMSQITASNVLRDRLTACAAVEGVPVPWSWVSEHIWNFASQPGWGDAWASFAVSNPNKDPGADESVITDAMILAATQAILAP